MPEETPVPELTAQFDHLRTAEPHGANDQRRGN